MRRSAPNRARFAQTGVRPLIALALVALYSGSTCVVAYSSCTCDPCVQPCVCRDKFCDQSAAVGFEEARRLSSHERSVVLEPDGRTTRIYSRIVGVSVERALGKTAYTSDELCDFASSVLSVNRELLGLSAWDLESIDVFDTARIVTFRAREGRRTERSLTMLFDPRGNLLEIDDASP